MDSVNRRKHFRIAMDIPVTWRVLTPEETMVLKDGPPGVLLGNKDLPGPIDELLLHAAPGSRDEQLYRGLQLINNKLDFLIDQIFLKSHENPPRRDEVVEISGSGLKFFSKAEIEAGALLKMNLIMPGTFQFQIDLIAEVLRIERSEEGRVMAARFVEIDEAARDAIVKVIFHKQRQEIRRENTDPGDRHVR